MRNAVLDTSDAVPLDIPSDWRATDDPGCYLVQSKGPLTDGFRNVIGQNGGRVVAYIPNNAYLVRIDATGANSIRQHPLAQAVLSFEPYYKLDNRLLAHVFDQKPLAVDARIYVTGFPGEKEQITAALANLGVTVVGEDRSPFGPMMVVSPDTANLNKIARLAEVQVVEVRRPRALMNDLARVRVNVSPDTINTTNYLGLTGKDILVNINDTGVDQTHPDLAGRVSAADPAYLVDPDGHGTHVAGIIASSGENSDSVTNVQGSLSGSNFRGMAPESKVFVLPISLLTGPLQTDAYLQETAAKAEAFISNNSWNYPGSFDYDSAAACYDAAVRDALPEEPGSTPIIFVFAAANEGDGDGDGLGGESGSILSPATGKNVITVGAIDSPRNITNGVVEIDDFGNNETNYPFLEMTDSDNQVSPYSSRGNVGLGLESEAGRFKPDIVAPGSMVLSTRSSQWEIPEFFTDAKNNRFENQVVTPGVLNNYSIYIPLEAQQLRIEVRPSRLGKSVPALPVYMKYGDFPSTNDFVTTNSIVLVPGNFPLQGGNLFYSIGNPTTKDVIFDLETLLVVTNTPGNYFEVLAEIETNLGSYYRYESGTSMAAPVVSGLLALIQEFFEQRLQRTYSPALLKALLINGAHSVNPIYSLGISGINYQGWGLVNLTNSIPGVLTNQNTTDWPLQYFDQNPTNALATGEQRTWRLTLKEEAVLRPLRATLVWTDPPGNPLAGVKLVNDLDLVLTNLTTGDVYWGNDIPTGNDFNQVGTTNRVGDSVNNVENVFLREPLGTNWAVTVLARRVNVNAVTLHTNNIVQDFALVISCGDLSMTNPFTLNLDDPAEEIRPRVIDVTNGVPVLGQRVGANSPLLGGAIGSTNQWQFYVFENIYDPTNSVGMTNGTNVAFITFVPPNLSRSRLIEADIDLYVSTNSALTNLDASVIALADKSTNRGGTELVFYTNAPIGRTFYIGVKAEDQQAAEYGFVSLSSDRPFDEDVNGNRLVHVMPPNLVIPDGSPQKPGGVYAFGIVTRPVTVQRVVVTNIIDHGNFGDLFGNLSHSSEFVVLNSHSLLGDYTSGTNVLVYDDSDRGDYLGSMPTDGPGSLNNFLGMEAAGVWLMTMVDSSLSHTGRLAQSEIFIERAQEGLYASVWPGRFVYFFTDVPDDAVKLTITLSGMTEGLVMPLELYVRREELPTRSEYDKYALIPPPGGSLALGTNDVPPLAMGRYYIGVFNPNSVVASFYITADLKRSLDAAIVDTYISTNTPLAIKDDAITRSTVNVTADRILTDVKVGVRLDHPRVSDLVLHLVSPQGTRLLLAESRGGLDAQGYGSGQIDQTNLVFAGFTENTNLTTQPIKSAIPPFTTNATITPVFTNDFEGLLAGSYGRGSVVDGWLVTTNSVDVITTNNAVLGTNVLGLNIARIIRTVDTIPGKRYWLSFYFKSGDTNVISAQLVLDGKLQPWLVATNTDWQPYSLPFTASRAETMIEIEPAFRNDVLLDAFSLIEAGGTKYYLPEESMDVFEAEPSLGEWKMEIWDTRAGALDPSPTLITWQLQMTFVATNYGAITLTNGVPYNGRVTGGETKYFIVNAPQVARWATNWLFSANDLILLYNADGLPTGGPTDVEVDDALSGSEVLILNTTTAPLLRPGQRYYLGVKNAEPGETNNFTILVEFDRYDPTIPPVTALTNGVPLTAQVGPGTIMDYYQFTVSTNAAWATFELNHLSGNASLYLKRGGPLPTTDSYHYLSSNPGTQDEQIVVLTNSLPTPLAPGVWLLGVQNLETNVVDYTIVATEYITPMPAFIPLTNGVPYFSTVSNVIDYYEFFVEPDASWASFEVLNPDGNVNLVLRRWPLIPSPVSFDYQSINPGTNEELILIFTNSIPVPLTAGLWYLSVYNMETNPVNYNILATTYTGDIPKLITLTNGVAYTNTITPSVIPDLYRFDMSIGVTQAVFELFDLTGNVDLYARKGLPLINETNAFYASTNAMTTNELIVLLTNSVPMPVSPGIWFLAALNRETNDVTYTIRATEYVEIPPEPGTNIIITPWLNLTNNSLCISWNSLIGTNYYVQGRVNVIDPGWNTISPTITATSIVTTYCISLTNSNHFFQVVQGISPLTPPTNAPPPFMTVPPVLLPSGLMLLSWDSVPGAVYEVQVTTNWVDWLTLTNITATGVMTTYVDPTPVLDQSLRFYRVRVTGGGIVPPSTNVPPAQILVPPVVLPGGAVQLTWDSVPAVVYIVEVTTNWTAWNVLTNITATGVQTTYVDTTPTSVQPIRFYRVRAIGSGTPPVQTNAPPAYIGVPPVVQPDGLVRLTWTSIAGAVYSVQATTNWTDWLTLSNITATGTETTYVDPTPMVGQPLRFYRVVVISGGPVIPPGGDTNAPPVQLQVTMPLITTNGFSINWTSQIGIRYQVEASTNLVSWQTLTNMTAVATNSVFLDLLPVDSWIFRFYRVLIQP
jgi:subtilisin family serine protease